MAGKRPPDPPKPLQELFKDDDWQDDPGQHGNRKRQKPHVEGNFATTLFVTVPARVWRRPAWQKVLGRSKRLLEDVQKRAGGEAAAAAASFDMGKDGPHISLSKTVMLRFHFIQGFVESCKAALGKCDSFTSHFDGELSVFANEPADRYFAALVPSAAGHKQWVELIGRVDQLVTSYGLEPFYKEKQPHLSLAWCFGSQEWVAPLTTLTNESSRPQDTASIRFWPSIESHLASQSSDTDNESVGASIAAEMAKGPAAGTDEDEDDEDDESPVVGIGCDEGLWFDVTEVAVRVGEVVTVVPLKRAD
ncbi:unnamed protein product [Vitrella brassicaformis CCMP3155]|uniref:U6 snRNA phosphodiesterase 1 n=1 Tax=Vitrella brassicaformis (strain CCMP3155) TaxID=1169540 RepID=A0A0G4G3L6_VITBC|nr:unnamed protein product [Vitrella brassicaformis CCMP3155]|eukprot:CEM22542.1 unnamed protein product [Vitrella brassicaformis CCMP3155]